MKDIGRQAIDIGAGMEVILSRCTAFEKKVLRAVWGIKPGQTRTYSWIARKIGQPGSQRAVGRVLKKNPLPFIIPCHRVITASGKLGGYSRGVGLKRALLAFERQLMAGT